METWKVGTSKNGKEMHYSVGAVIKKDGKYLLIDRKNVPLGFAGVAGHVDENETAEESLKREVKEESGLDVLNAKLLFEEDIDFETCVGGCSLHNWKVYACETTGEVHQEKKEEKSIGWYSAEEIKNLQLEPAWEHWFKKIGVVGDTPN